MTNSNRKNAASTRWVADQLVRAVWLLIAPLAFLVWYVNPPGLIWYAVALLGTLGLSLLVWDIRTREMRDEHLGLVRAIGINQRLILESQRRLSERMVYLEFRVSKKSS